MADRPENAPTVQNRWWVDTDKSGEPAKAILLGARPPVGSRFFDIGYTFDQEHAKRRLTDSNLKFLDEARPEPNEWRVLYLVPDERIPATQLERLKRCVPLPPARGA